MPSNELSDLNILNGYNPNQGLSNLSPRGSLGPSDPYNEVTNSTKRDRRDSAVRFREPEEVLSSPSRETASAINGSASANGKYQPYVQSLEERIDYLEGRLQGLEDRKVPDGSEVDSSEKAALSTEPQWMTWQEYLEPTAKPTSILEVLIQKPHSNSRRKSIGGKPLTETIVKEVPKTTSSSKGSIERIRIRSPYIIEALKTVTEQKFTNNSCLTVHQPFKLFLFYADVIEEYLYELEDAFRLQTFCPLGEDCKGFISIDNFTEEPSGYFQIPTFKKRKLAYRTISFDVMSDVDNQELRSNSLAQEYNNPNPETTATTVTRQRSASSPIVNRGLEDECKHEVSDELLAQKETIIHLRALLKFIQNDMQDIFAQHNRLRSSEVTTVAFQDLWHLYHAGDLVVTDDEANPKISRVSILPACDLFSSRRPVKKVKLKTDGSHQLVESVYEEVSMNIINIDLFNFDFDGQHFGPVESRFTMVSYEGEKKVTDLPLYPLRFRKDASTIMAKMQGRGAKFRDLCNIQHCEYTGLSVDEPREQVRFKVFLSAKSSSSLYLLGRQSSHHRHQPGFS